MFVIYTVKDGKKKAYLTSKRLQQCIELAKIAEAEGHDVLVESDGAEDPKVYYKTEMGVACNG